ncbi:2-phosphosulfolactate phosphatase [Amycolatopsis panacis]|uniref:2-phosphosulfolactate phosphatase n=1 Tax=Amycolatopsis panacis TaxID=2340917 RepID=UPI001F27833C|nr:2-phosphosulfolactate phosphatase [Amycolatopsis panacis]
MCATAAETGAHVLAGCLRNASAVAAKASALAGGEPVGVIPAGERWGVDLFNPGEEFGPLRPCVEDQLGAGAIVAALAEDGRSLSAEAALAKAAYSASDVHAALRTCVSGRELATAGHGNDVTLAAQLDVSGSVPVLSDGVLEAR